MYPTLNISNILRQKIAFYQFFVYFYCYLLLCMFSIDEMSLKMLRWHVTKRSSEIKIKMLQPRLLLQHLNAETTSKFRKWEITNKKIINATRANVFNQNCLREHICPKSIKQVLLIKHIATLRYNTFELITFTTIL